MAVIPEGYSTDPGFDAAEDHAGPFYYRESEGAFDCAFVAKPENCNVNSLVHGGVLMTFADFALCLAATDHYKQESCASISFNCDFVAAA
ncbi:MAG: PaaI family thioesterase, partial [Gammaproteobacteria bacterium]|nr:PaaI family thioesterase [Gammaproteobacteria bacterium]